MGPEEQLAAGRLGQVAGRWRLERVLGVGGMAAVYAGQGSDGQWAAIKILHPHVGVRAEVRERFFREGYVANSIQHPGVVRALEHGDAGEHGAFLAMELLRGETLTERLKRHGVLPIEELLGYADQILDVLVVAHALGIVHRDLKPDNLFVTTEGRIKILDFGLARILEGVPDQKLTRSGLALGTLPYMAPEQALGRRDEIDGRTDLFAVGATLFRTLTGRRLHEADSEAELLMAMASRPAPPLAGMAPELPPDVCRIVDLALAFSRDARYPDARTMQADLRAAREGRRPEYALSRVLGREEATRIEPGPRSAPASQTAPLSTMPLHEYRKDAVAAPASAGAVPDPPEPAPPPAEVGRARGSRGPWLALGLGGLFLALGGAFAMVLLRGRAPAEAIPGPEPSASLGVALDSDRTQGAPLPDAPPTASGPAELLPPSAVTPAAPPSPGVRSAPAAGHDDAREAAPSSAPPAPSSEASGGGPAAGATPSSSGPPATSASAPTAQSAPAVESAAPDSPGKAPSVRPRLRPAPLKPRHSREP